MTRFTTAAPAADPALDSSAYVAQVKGLSHQYGEVIAIDNIHLDIPRGRMIGLIGPDGVGKSSLLSLLAGSKHLQKGEAWVLGGNMASREHREQSCPRIAYMPQGLGKNLYPTLSIEENLQFFGRLFNQTEGDRRKRIDELTLSTGLHPFLNRPIGKLSGGMKQKVGLCCSLIHDPDLLILDEPTTGVDPLSRAQFWDLIASIRVQRPTMSVVVATSYMEEADRFDWLVAMNAGKILGTGTPQELKAHTQTHTLDDAFVALLPPADSQQFKEIHIPPLNLIAHPTLAIEAQNLTMQFGDFIAVNSVNFKIQQGEIFGFLGSNGCGKSTTMKMLTGLLTPSSGEAFLFGEKVNADDLATRRNLGYMSQGFSLYSELSVTQNLALQGRLYGIPEDQLPQRIEDSIRDFDLAGIRHSMPAELPLGMRQRLSLAAAVIHQPKLLILDEPTSGVDPVARNVFWQSLIKLSRESGVTIFITTHFMNEAQMCDRISLMNAGQVVITDSPDNVIQSCHATSMENAFLYYLERATGQTVSKPGQDPKPAPASEQATASAPVEASTLPEQPRGFSVGRAWSYCLLETLQLVRDPVRATLALLGTTFLMLVMGYGITLDVDNLRYAVWDRDQSHLSHDYANNIAGSSYFVQQAPIRDYADLDRRMASGELSMVVEIPSDFAIDVGKRNIAHVGVWVDGAMPTRAATIQGYIQAMHLQWLGQQFVRKMGKGLNLPVDIESRYRYNPNVLSLPAMVPAVIPILLLMIPAMLTALSVVREKEMGSILNLYVTPVSKAEFLLGKQTPYVVLALFNFGLMLIMALVIFQVDVTGDVLTLALAAVIYSIASTGIGLLASSFMKSQVAAVFITIIVTLVPAIQFSGLLNPVSSLSGSGHFIGLIYPSAHFLTISRGVFSKGLGVAELSSSLLSLLASVPVILGLAVYLLKKQER
ncbi:ribosome-associated ATPase/putative transporter RbbA [Curvibacter sp. HBC28]|uniref:Ribosome-associated ATPase/putative transporter RbbA n=1 Tax=Curvibacter microcysteis TaxID=3026419 RepID=A0ABT5MIQ3_9BURK|nr:ribosome-associated ATPase/putative transporter RbbA [Curvibacter sp. HBC28]MDD0815777.1 ribosome-associated ATPase/putative transporter RbbA [Curvibacter sp. HBC28]